MRGEEEEFQSRIQKRLLYSRIEWKKLVRRGEKGQAREEVQITRPSHQESLGRGEVFEQTGRSELRVHQEVKGGCTGD